MKVFVNESIQGVGRQLGEWNASVAGKTLKAAPRLAGHHQPEASDLAHQE